MRLPLSRYNTTILREKERAFLTQAYAFIQSCDTKEKWLAFKEANQPIKTSNLAKKTESTKGEWEGSIRPP